MLLTSVVSVLKISLHFKPYRSVPPTALYKNRARPSRFPRFPKLIFRPLTPFPSYGYPLYPAKTIKNLLKFALLSPPPLRVPKSFPSNTLNTSHIFLLTSTPLLWYSTWVENYAPALSGALLFLPLCSRLTRSPSPLGRFRSSALLTTHSSLFTEFKEPHMPSLDPVDRFNLCRFTFADGRRCRTPRLSTNPNFCHYHAQLETQSQFTTQLANEISQLLANPRLSPNDLSSAIARLIPAVLNGHLKIRTARTVAYLLQTLLQTVRLSQSGHLQPAVTSPANPSPSNLQPSENPLGSAGAYSRLSSSLEPPQHPDPSPTQTVPNRNAPSPAPPSIRSATKPTAQAVHAALTAARRLFPTRANGPLTPASATLTKNDGTLPASPPPSVPSPSQR